MEPIVEIPTLDAYKEQLKKHDWFYDFSDDGRVWRAGDAERTRLKGLARKHGVEYQKAFNEEYLSHFKEPHFKDVKPPFEV